MEKRDFDYLKIYPKPGNYLQHKYREEFPTNGRILLPDGTLYPYMSIIRSSPRFPTDPKLLGVHDVNFHIFKNDDEFSRRKNTENRSLPLWTLHGFIKTSEDIAITTKRTGLKKVVEDCISEQIDIFNIFDEQMQNHPYSKPIELGYLISLMPIYTGRTMRLNKFNEPHISAMIEEALQLKNADISK